ncbi:Gpi1-domain-containing protein, partial [Punctularia strigosozonata HHB-11173 SS5]|uniref:Gpi1-domain-containing protein n=1 Tax=Punctularia strigosozonata (strain HHB-11173) TaxID=741275 RepID=UPI0004416A9D
FFRFYNSVWLILNDVIVGLAFGVFLRDNHQALAKMLATVFTDVLLSPFPQALLWLDQWPAGLKLNGPLSRFCCMLFIRIIKSWSRLMIQVTPLMPAATYLIGSAGFCGLTMILSLFSDLLDILTLHIYICYALATTIFHAQVRTAVSLWNLFRGKRFNVLRNRVDSWVYEVDQLLLGTMLFTLLAFLFPTVLAYYAVFMAARLLVIFLHAINDTFLAAMNHFPLFALMLRLKDPWRLPGMREHVIPTMFRSKDILLSKPTSYSTIFHQYGYLWSQLSGHYHPRRIAQQLLTGRYIRPIPTHSIRYGAFTPERDT